jgi:hypothetical protein
VLGAKVRETFAYTDFLDLEIYGRPNDAIERWLPKVTEGIRFTHYPMHWGGFTRLGSV